MFFVFLVMLNSPISIGLKGDEKCNEKKMTIIKKIFDLVNANEVHTKVTNDLIAFILSQVRSPFLPSRKT